MASRKKALEQEGSTALVKNGGQELALPEDMYTETAGAGTETAQADDYALPFIRILQKLSPQVDKGEGEYIRDAEPGMFCNTVSRSVYQTLLLIPCSFKKEMVEWKDRDAGGGFVKRYEWGQEPTDTHEHPKRPNLLVRENGNHLVETRYHFCMAIDPDSGEIIPVVCTFVSTQLKKSRRWLSLIAAKKVRKSDGSVIQAPSFANIYEASSIAESNDAGNWFGWDINWKEPVRDISLFLECKALWEAVKTGEVQAGVPDDSSPTATPNGDEVM